MKLIFCPLCHDAQGLIMQTWRCCLCGKSGGQYNIDGMTATIGGMARVFGVGNPFFDDLYPYLEEKGKRRMWKKHYGHEMGDCWWGEYEGDRQIFRIFNPEGPRLDVQVKCFDGHENIVIVIDKRKFLCGDQPCEYRFTVRVPRNPNVKIKLTRWEKYGKKKRRNSTTAGK